MGMDSGGLAPPAPRKLEWVSSFLFPVPHYTRNPKLKTGNSLRQAGALLLSYEPTTRLSAAKECCVSKVYPRPYDNAKVKNEIKNFS